MSSGVILIPCCIQRISFGKEERSRERFKTVPYKYIEEVDDPLVRGRVQPTKLAKECDLVSTIIFSCFF
jgi:hypothetical protein